MKANIPYMYVVIAACIVAVTGYAGFSIWVVVELKDATMVGDVIGTWKSFAVAAFAFWIGSSSGGKAKDTTDDMANRISTKTRSTTEIHEDHSDGSSPVVSRSSSIAITEPLQQRAGTEDRASDSIGKTD